MNYYAMIQILINDNFMCCNPNFRLPFKKCLFWGKLLL